MKHLSWNIDIILLTKKLLYQVGISVVKDISSNVLQKAYVFRLPLQITKKLFEATVQIRLPRLNFEKSFEISVRQWSSTSDYIWPFLIFFHIIVIDESFVDEKRVLRFFFLLPVSLMSLSFSTCDDNGENRLNYRSNRMSCVIPLIRPKYHGVENFF